MDPQEKLNVLNSLEIVESEGGDWCYVMVETSEDNMEKIRSIGADEDAMRSLSGDGCIDILPIAFDCGASYFTGSKFIIDRKVDVLNNLREALDSYEKTLNQGINYSPEQLEKISSLSLELVSVLDE